MRNSFRIILSAFITLLLAAYITCGILFECVALSFLYGILGICGLAIMGLVFALIYMIIASVFKTEKEKEDEFRNG